MDKYKNYESTARTILRLMWFLDFVFYMIEGLVEDKGKAMSSICQNAYNKSMYDNHPMHIAMGFKAGIMLVPGLEMKSLFLIRIILSQEG